LFLQEQKNDIIIWWRSINSSNEPCPLKEKGEFVRLSCSEGGLCMGMTWAVLITSLVSHAQAAFHVQHCEWRVLTVCSLRSEVCTNKWSAAAGFAMAASKTSRVVIVPGNSWRGERERGS
jgi:hypothetical protein